MADADLPLHHVHVPVEDRSDTGAVFILHGRGADEQDLLPVADHLPDSLQIISLRAPDRLGPGYTWYALDTSDGLHASQPDPDQFRRSLDLVTDSIDAAVEAYDINDTSIGVLGFSQGAITALSLLLEDPTRFAWVVALHGYLAESHTDTAPTSISGKPVFLGAGETDQIIPPERAETAASRLRELGCNVTFDSYPTGHGIGQAELDALVTFVHDQVT